MAFIKKQALQNYWDTARPSGLDITFCLVIATLFMLALLLPTILDRYNTFGADEVLRSGAGSVISKFLLRIDQLSFTNSVVTFLLWGIVGMVVYGLISSVLRALANAEYEREMASDEYVHPAAFSRVKFWHEELLISASTIITVLLLVATTAFTALTLLPTAITRLRELLLSGSHSIWLAFASTILFLFASCVVMLCFKLWHHRMVLFEKT